MRLITDLEKKKQFTLKRNRNRSPVLFIRGCYAISAQWVHSLTKQSGPVFTFIKMRMLHVKSQRCKEMLMLQSERAFLIGSLKKCSAFVPFCTVCDHHNRVTRVKTQVHSTLFYYCRSKPHWFWACESWGWSDVTSWTIWTEWEQMFSEKPGKHEWGYDVIGRGL